MRVEPASSALSTSSLTTEAGRSTTSPAAIWLRTTSGSSRIAPVASTWSPAPRCSLPVRSLMLGW